MQHLRAQTIAEQIELVIVAPRADRVHIPPEDEASFHSVRIAEINEFGSLAVARTAGVAVASAPVVAFNEDHSFPEPGWAAALLEAHRRGYAGVAPQMKNANPGSTLSGGVVVLHFGGAVERERDLKTVYRPRHTTGATRGLCLLEVGDRLTE